MSNENALAIAAINDEARRRGMNYGELVSKTTRSERDEIVRRFDRVRAEQMRRRSLLKYKESKRKR